MTAPSQAFPAPFDLARKLTQRSVVQRIREQSQSGAGPLVIELDLTTHCDLACPECISSALLNSGSLPAKRALELVEEFRSLGVRAVILIGGGEPLVHSSASQVIKALAANGIQVGLTTNGTLLHRHIEAIAQSVSWTRVSLDAGSAHTYEKIRPTRSGGNAFEDVVSNLRLLNQKRHGAAGVSFVLLDGIQSQGRNLEDIALAGAVAKDIGCDYIEYKLAMDQKHHLIPLRQVDVGAVRNELASVRQLEDASFRVFTVSGLEKALHMKPLSQPKTYGTCPIAPLRTVVTPSGVYQCPYHRGNREAKLGDVRALTLNDIWWSQKRLAVLEKIQPPRDCTFHCIRHESNEMLLESRERFLDAGIADFDMFI